MISLVRSRYGYSRVRARFTVLALDTPSKMSYPAESSHSTIAASSKTTLHTRCRTGLPVRSSAPVLIPSSVSSRPSPANRSAAAAYDGARMPFTRARAPRRRSAHRRRARRTGVVRAPCASPASPSSPARTALPAEDSTEVLVWYSPTAIYFGVRAYERMAGRPPCARRLADRDKIYDRRSDPDPPRHLQRRTPGARLRRQPVRRADGRHHRRARREPLPGILV